MSRKIGFILSLSALIFMSASIADTIVIKWPEHFPEIEYTFGENELSREKIELGRALFYDPLLSADNSISCASCHSPYNAFAHTDHDLSHGINDLIGIRNAPALFNLAWQKDFMWDGAIRHLDHQALAPIEAPTEMAMPFDSLIQLLTESELYPPLFYEAFGDSLITGERFLKSLSQFQLSLISAGAKYDQVMLGIEEFTDQEAAGYELFKNHCANCHSEPLFTNGEFANNGLTIDSTLNDFGRMKITGLRADSLQFKIPSLRNLEYTYPYMHDGRFNSLSEVLSHYTEDVTDQLFIDARLTGGIEISENEEVDLMTFLLTLTDRDFVFNAKHQFPRKILLEGRR